MTPTFLNNRYRVIQTLGSGGFGTTYLAEDTQMPSCRKCVIKQLKPIANNPEVYQLVQERFQREAAILEELGDVNDQIPRLYAYFAEAGEFYLIQEWIEGMTLNSRVRSSGAQPETVVQEILTSLLLVLDYVHSKHIIHRDIKPDNIILQLRDSKPVLIDFGAVRQTMGTMATFQSGSGSSIVIGTPGFMASEQAAGRPIYSSDLYSLGLTMIYLLTTKSPKELELDSQTGEILWRSDAKHVSPAFAEILERAVQYHPRDRYPTAQDMLAALQQITPFPTILPVPNFTSSPSELELSPTYLAASVSAVNLSLPATILTPLTHAPFLSQPAIVDFNQADAQVLPTEIRGWNWGAFLLPGFWSLGNQVWIGLLSWSGLVSWTLGWFMTAGVLGAKGNEWAWKSRQWQSVKAFKQAQRGWAIGGAVAWCNLTVLLVIAGIHSSHPPKESTSADPSSVTIATTSNSNSRTIKLFGTTDILSEPTTNMDGTWQLSYIVDRLKHDGTLVMQGKTGTLTTRLSESGLGQVQAISQTMRLWSSPRGFILLGYNPVDQEKQAIDLEYSPDNFLFEQQADGSIKVTNCNDRGICTDVVAQIVGKTP
jgi:serine/threonine protein kinase